MASRLKPVLTRALEAHPACSPWRSLAGWLAVVFFLTLPAPLFGAFGVVNSGGYYTVDTAGGLVFKVSQSDGSITSLVYGGTEYQSSTKSTHIASGLGTATVTAATYGANYIKITITTSPTNSVVSSLTHYLMARNGDPIIYMATYPTAEPAVGELRWITRLKWNLLPNGPPQSDNDGNTGAIESTDVFGHADGHTSSKYHGRHRALELDYSGATGSGVGVWMVFDNRESSSSGPYYRDIENQGGGSGGDQEVYNYMNSGHVQTEPWRTNVLCGPYALVFNNGTPPPLSLDYSWIETGGLNLTGWVPASGRGAVTGIAYGIPAGFQGVVGFANTNAQYWAVVATNGVYMSPLMKPGTYTATLYKGELAVTNRTVTVSAGNTNSLNLVSAESAPSHLFKIGEWDGTPAGFLNASNIVDMHPSDVRNTVWLPTTYTVGSSSVGDFPSIQMRGTNSPTTILFNLAPNQIANLTFRIGMTCAYNNGRPEVVINGTSRGYPGASSQPNSRTFTLGTWRGNNWIATYSIPSGNLLVGQNTLTINPVSGSSDLGPWLSAGWVFDALELDIPNTAPAIPAAPDALSATPLNGSQILLTWADNSSNEVNFLIERSPDNVTYSLVTAVTGGVTALTDPGLSPGSTYYYRVRANNAGGGSAYSNVASATTLVPQFTSIAASNGTVIFSGIGGTAGGTAYTLATTNAAVPVAQWPVIATNQFNLDGSFLFTNTVDPTAQQQFFRLRLP
jgi:rhamnogalacturonan endolyase